MSKTKTYPIRKFDTNGNYTYFEDSKGFWYKKEYDANGKLTYYESSTGYWEKSEYDANRNRTYYERSDGTWWKSEFDANGNVTYVEDSEGRVEGTKRVEPTQEDDEITLKEIKDLIAGMKRALDLIEKRLG
jgi:hypothetical protein